MGEASEFVHNWQEGKRFAWSTSSLTIQILVGKI